MLCLAKSFCQTGQCRIERTRHRRRKGLGRLPEDQHDHHAGTSLCCTAMCGARCAASLRCCTALLRAARGRERGYQPCTKLFAKVAVQIVAVNLIWAFVGVFCAMCASRGDGTVCIWMCVTDTLDVVLCCPLIYALPREITLSHRSMYHGTDSAQKEERPWPTV